MSIGSLDLNNSLTLEGAASTNNFSSPFVRSVWTGATSEASINLNHSTAYLELLSYFTIANGIIRGLNLTLVGGVPKVQAGLALCGGFIEIVNAVSLPTLTNGESKAVWLIPGTTDENKILTTAVDSSTPGTAIKLGCVFKVGGSYIFDTVYDVPRIYQGVGYVKTRTFGIPTFSSLGCYIISDSVWTEVFPNNFIRVHTNTQINTKATNIYIPEGEEFTATNAIEINGELVVNGTFYVTG